MDVGGGGPCMWSFMFVFILEKYNFVKTNYNLKILFIIIIGVVNNNNNSIIVIIIIIIIIILCDSEIIDDFLF